MIARLRQKRAQAAVETALILPLLVFLMLGSADLGRAFYLKLEMSGASRAGMRMAVLGQAVDIGNAVRAEPNTAIANTAAAWGQTGPGQVNGDCTSTLQKCGDPAGCVPGSFTVSTQLACFAVRECTSWTNGVCTPAPGGWGTRPAAGGDHAVEVITVYRFVPATPIITNFANNGAFYLAADTMGLQLY